MSCWQRPDWMQFYDCVYAHLTEPVYIWFPYGLTYLFAVAVGLGLGWLLFSIGYRIFGYGVLKPFDLLGDWIGDAVWHTREWYRRQRAVPGTARQPEAGQAGETPAGTLREETIELEAEKALAGRRKEGD